MTEVFTIIATERYIDHDYGITSYAIKSFYDLDQAKSFLKQQVEGLCDEWRIGDNDSSWDDDHIMWTYVDPIECNETVLKIVGSEIDS